MFIYLLLLAKSEGVVSSVSNRVPSGIEGPENSMSNEYHCSKSRYNRLNSIMFLLASHVRMQHSSSAALLFSHGIMIDFSGKSLAIIIEIGRAHV